jgi:hypothetical protein
VGIRKLRKACASSSPPSAGFLFGRDKPEDTVASEIKLQ